MGVLKLNLRRCFSKFQCSHCLTLSATFACSPLGVEDIPKKVTESRSWWFKSHKLDIFTIFSHFSTFFRAKTSTLFGWIHPPSGGGPDLRAPLRRGPAAAEAPRRSGAGGGGKGPGSCLVGEKRWKKNGGKWWNCWVSSGQKNETLWNMEIDAPGQLRIVICYLSICWSPWRIEITILDGLV